MSIQNQDDDQKRQQQAAKDGGPDIVRNRTHQRRCDASSYSGICYLMFPVAALTALWYCADIFLKRQETEIGDVVPAPMGSLHKLALSRIG
ncbi:hypothetical protein [Methylomonas koyamae]|uniref:Uncharacterized protein n=1 Tax=Methylomonas koyamae TaxID=702114 RepID=A0A177P787_9GAMM|nr:hypothetical protein [Methylomonas koyamae]OAI25180.1 hypothetical protein A1355_19935 [Methylomonas koyamae]